MKLYINNPKEDWIADRLKKEWIEYNPKSNKSSLFNSEIVWLMSPWTWKKIPKTYLKNKKVLCTIHHFDEDKFKDSEKKNFYSRDFYVDEYHVISSGTKQFLSKLVDKPITKIPWWANNNLWFHIEEKDELRLKYNFSSNDYLIGSLQRDTEGNDMISPKLSKGPDRFLEIVKSLNKKKSNLVVVLTGKRRNYLVNKLHENKIKFKYFEMASFSELNELYNILNLYIVSSRVEGGPQSIIEASLCKTPIISTDVGIASEILSEESIFEMDSFSAAKPNVEHAYNTSLKYTIPGGFDKFNKLIEKIYES